MNAKPNELRALDRCVIERMSRVALQPPSIDQLAHALARSKSTIWRALRRLEQRGYVRKTVTHFTDGRQVVRYLVEMPFSTGRIIPPSPTNDCS